MLRGVSIRHFAISMVVLFVLALMPALALAVPSMTKLDFATFSGYIPADVVGDAVDELRLADGTQGVDGIPFFVDSNDDLDDDDDPLYYGVSWDIVLGPATKHDTKFQGNGYEKGDLDIDALLIAICIDTSQANFTANGGTIDSITLSEAVYGTVTLYASDFFELEDLGYRDGGGGLSFNPTDDDLVAGILLTGIDFNAGKGTDIGDFVLTLSGSIVGSALRVDLFGIDLSVGEVISKGANSSGGYDPFGQDGIIPEPATLGLVAVGLLSLPLLRSRRRRSG